MLSERNRRSALGYYGNGGNVYLMDLALGAIMSLEEWLDEALGNEFRFLIDTVDPEPLDFPVELHTDEEFEQLFEEVPDVALEDPEEAPSEKPKRTRAENRHMIEILHANHPEMSISEVAERVGVSKVTVRKYWK